ncbi:MAG: hypothetical protein WC477_07345 [Patescibacteria group bacterium]
MSKAFSVEVFADGRPLTHLLKTPQVGATNHGTAARKAYVLAKPFIKRGAKVVTLRVTRL